MGIAIPLYKGRKVISYVWISEEDGPSISCHRWTLSPDGYAYGSIRKKDGITTTISMHRYLFFGTEAVHLPEKPMIVKHLNGNRLDNRRINLHLSSR